MIKKILKIICLVGFISLLSSCLIVNTNEDIDRYYSVSIENDSISTIWDWYLFDTNTNNLYGREDVYSTVYANDTDILEFKSNKKYKCYIYFDSINYFEIPEKFYLNENKIIRITGSRWYPEYSISKDYSRSAITTNNITVETAVQKNK